MKNIAIYKIMHIDLTQVAGTLKRGELFDSSNRKKVIITYTLFVCLCLILLIVLVVMFSLEQAKNPKPIVDFVLTLIGTNLVISLIPIALLFLVLKNEKIRSEILLCSEDAVEVYASSKRVGEQSNGDAIVDAIKGPSLIKIQVTFKINGKSYTRVSGKAGRVGSPDGFEKIWLKYSDRAIKILYSPKYDQVIVLKDKEKN